MLLMSVISDKNFAHFHPSICERKRNQKPKECSASQSEASEVTQVRNICSFISSTLASEEKSGPKRTRTYKLRI